jgi:1-acyl-sn-glycerol-3-phosphate acyltransferase
LKALRAVWRLLRATLHVLHGLWVMFTQFERLDAAGRQQRIQWWSAKLLRTMGLALHVEGTPHAGSVLVVANHVSWLDIAALHASCPQARFVSKADVLAWPLIGRLVSGAGTLFIERTSKRDALRVVHQVAQALKEGHTIAVFPEGTTSDGRGMLPFHANLLQAAISSSAPVQPAVLRFSQPGHAVSPAIEFVGNTTLVQSMWRIASADGLRAHLQWLAPVPSAEAERRQLAAQLQALIAQRLG